MGGGAWGTVVTGQRMHRLIHAFRDASMVREHTLLSPLAPSSAYSRFRLADYFSLPRRARTKNRHRHQRAAILP